MPIDKITQKALEIGLQQAKEVLEIRNRAIELRPQRLEIQPQLTTMEYGAFGGGGTSDGRGTPARTPKIRLKTEVIVAEGDSWFDYPFHSVIHDLEDRHGYNIESVAHRGDPIEDIAYGKDQLLELTRRIEKLTDLGLRLKAVLLSGGGNDVAGTEFAMLLNHCNSPIRGLDPIILDTVINKRIWLSYVTILRAVTYVCQERIGSAVPILIHGYDYPVPDGRGYIGGWSILTGPWLEPGFRAKGYDKLDERKELAHEMIERFNKMLQELVKLKEFKHVHYIDLRNTLQTGDDYTQWWDNELHPTPQGFHTIADKFAEVLAVL